MSKWGREGLSIYLSNAYSNRGSRGEKPNGGGSSERRYLVGDNFDTHLWKRFTKGKREGVKPEEVLKEEKRSSHNYKGRCWKNSMKRCMIGTGGGSSAPIQTEGVGDLEKTSTEPKRRGRGEGSKVCL